MNIQEAAIVVAEFDGWRKSRTHDSFWKKRTATGCAADLNQRYLSLDSLVPVWEKLPVISNLMDIYSQKIFRLDYYTGDKCDRSFRIGSGNTIQEAALIATAKCIKELNKE